MSKHTSNHFVFVPNYDEAKVPKFIISNPLVTFESQIIDSVAEWESKRRLELLDFFTNNIYGKVPNKLTITSSQIVEQSDNAIKGKAIRKQIKVSFERNEKKLTFNLLLYLPKNVRQAPLFLGLNFYGNHTLSNDSNVVISDAWTVNNDVLGITNNRLDENSRGVCASRWPIEKIIDAGFGLATLFYGEIDPDKNDMTDGIHSLFYSEGKQNPANNEWKSIAAWSWGLSRAMDYLENDEGVNASKVVVFGHSRLGKAALWAGATDRRFSAIISNNSGCGGAALSKRKFGETIWRINNRFPHWFCDNFKTYSNNEEHLPVDQHELLCLIAPRPLYIASATEDQWADPRGEYLSVYYATPVYELYNKKGAKNIDLPPINFPIHNTLAYHIREGKHDITHFDWDWYIKWAKEQLF